ncbi:MAG TPA: hypothetical protein VD928_01030 [Candidatus Paceibacterota bacterium]|nr:hypothetical protein [Candidatus Paceibacterota bacterium]
MPEGDHLSWSVTTHEHKERSMDWYWALGLLALVGIGIAVFFNNILLAIIIAIGAGSIGALALRGPREHTVRIDDRGLSLDGTRYRWDAIYSFWVEHDEEYPKLFITMRGVLMPHLTLTLDNRAQGEAVREHLRNYVEEEEQGPHIGERLTELLGL